VFTVVSKRTFVIPAREIVLPAEAGIHWLR
jgi:hypothetical protein